MPLSAVKRFVTPLIIILSRSLYIQLPGSTVLFKRRRTYYSPMLKQLRYSSHRVKITFYAPNVPLL